MSKGYGPYKRYELLSVPIEDLYEGSNAIVKVQCDYCGRIYTSPYSYVFLNRENINKDCCRKCIPKKISDGSKHNKAITYIQKAQEVCNNNGYELLTTPEEYEGVKMQVRFICPKHGEQHMMLDNMIRGHKCRKCSYEQRGRNLAYDIENVKNNIESINGNTLLNPEEYTDTVTRNLRIRCSCGRVFTTSYTNYRKANVNRCPSCAQSISVAENKIMHYLDDQHISYVREKRFIDCRDKKALPFDFYIPSRNLVIEYDGKHHYQPIQNRGSFETIIQHDKIKDDYCKRNGIDILRIPYWDTKDMVKIIENKLSA